MLVFGVRRDAVFLGDGGIHPCHHCGGPTQHSFVLFYQYFHAAFIFGWLLGRQHRLACEQCKIGLEISEESVPPGLRKSKPVPFLRRRGLALFLVLLMLTVSGLWALGDFLLAPASEPAPDRLVIEDAAQPTNLWLAAKAEYPSQLSLRLRGHIEGRATVSVTEPGRPSIGNMGLSSTLNGDVDWVVGTTWSTMGAVVHYTPDHVSSGRLSVEYRLR